MCKSVMSCRKASKQIRRNTRPRTQNFNGIFLTDGVHPQPLSQLYAPYSEKIVEISRIRDEAIGFEMYTFRFPLQGNSCAVCSNLEHCLRDVEIRKFAKSDIGGREARIDFDGVILRPGFGRPEDEIDANIAPQNRDAIHGSLP